VSSRRLAILRAQAAAAALTSATTQDTAYGARCAAFERGDHLPPHVAIGVDLAQPGADQMVVTTPTPATSDTWHSEPPPVPGVYIASGCRRTGVQRHWDGKTWSRSGNPAVRVANGATIEWLRLVKADAAPTPTPTWRRGFDIPEAERTGLWHRREAPAGPGPAEPADRCPFHHAEYRAAAPGTKAGNPYDEAKYGSAT
jgi:hypothetical protein